MDAGTQQHDRKLAQLAAEAEEIGHQARWHNTEAGEFLEIVLADTDSDRATVAYWPSGTVQPWIHANGTGQLLSLSDRILKLDAYLRRAA